jgi:hypothetical protein
VCASAGQHHVQKGSSSLPNQSRKRQDRNCRCTY